MSLASGTKLGPYEIQTALGAGGMGEVYRARDTRLERTVAVKILPSHLSSNPEAKQRFEREARTISSLNHPNICVLHDVGSQDGASYLVMEFVDGETLDSRLQKGPLPLKQVLECAVQICDALEKAHRVGIVHRDLKPGNIMLTASGAKLLDFGLAKPVAMLGTQALSDQGNLTPSTPTMNVSMLSAPPAALTQQGMIVGTFQYMAPEVLQGQEADARSDIFSFGCVLYEMITGRRAFEGKSQLSVMSAILEKDPEPLGALQPTAPPALDYAVQTCLEKNPDNRFQTAHDLKLQLAWIAKAGSQTGAPAVVTGRRKGNALWIGGLAVLAIAAIVIAAGLWSARQPGRVVRSNILPPEGTVFETMYRNGAPALSPDGTRMAFVARQDGRNSLWMRSLDRLAATPLRGTDDAFFPFWSPDGTSLAFFMQGKLWRMDLNGGSPVAICDAPEPRGGSWGRGNVIVFPPSSWGPITQVPAEGGTSKLVTKAVFSNGGVSDRWPFFLPDGRHFLFVHTAIGDADERNEIHFASLDGDQEQVLLRGRFYTVQYASGWMLADRGGSLLAWRFDPSSGKISGDAVQVVDKIASDDITAQAVFSVSARGDLLYQQGSGATGDRHVWLDTTGKQLSQVSEPGVYGGSRLSPDGSRIATPVVGQAGDNNLWMWDLAGGTRARLSTGDGIADAPVWSADGRTLYFGSFEITSNREEIRELPADGSQPERTLIKADTDVFPTDSTSDGKWLLYEESQPDAQRGAVLKAFPLVKGLEPFTVVDAVARLSNARVKPDSNDWLAYQANVSGRPEVYLTRFPHPGVKYQVSQTGASQPVWSKDGKKLYYLDTSQRMIAVDIRTASDSVQIGAPMTLFQTGMRSSIFSEGYDVTRDGRFLVVNSV
ncbi:MAG: protein kinase, partial [Candidatus Sulfotelmatobacter sp.]